MAGPGDALRPGRCADTVATGGHGGAAGLADEAHRHLSGGQKARLALLLLRLQAPNFHPLDEPANHLDIEGQQALEAELTAPEATCLLVSHDRHFVRAAGTRFWEIRGRRLEEVEGPVPFLAAMAGA